MLLYGVRALTTALNTANDLLTITGGGTRSMFITEIDAEGAGTSSTYAEMVFSRVTTAGATPVPFTPVPINQAGTASAFTCATGWTTQPVQTANTNVHTFGINVNGQRYFWRAQNVYDCIPIQGGAVAASQLSMRPTVTGSSNLSMRLRVVEV
jgi:hypothetical protein